MKDFLVLEEGKRKRFFFSHMDLKVQMMIFIFFFKSLLGNLSLKNRLKQEGITCMHYLPFCVSVQCVVLWRTKRQTHAPSVVTSLQIQSQPL